MVFLVKLVIGLILDFTVALALMIVSPWTGVDALQGLDYWNFFWVVVFVNFLLAPTVFSIRTADI